MEINALECPAFFNAGKIFSENIVQMVLFNNNYRSYLDDYVLFLKIK
jgi:hypothetical protein